MLTTLWGGAVETAKPQFQERWQVALQLFADMLRLKLQPNEAGLHLSPHEWGCSH